LGRLGWSLRRIRQETGVRRETASTYLKAAGIPVQPPGRRAATKAAIPVSPVTTDSDAIGPSPPNPLSDADPIPSASVCEPFRAAIELGLRQGRNAVGIWQDLVSQAGFAAGYQTVKRFVRKLRGPKRRVSAAQRCKLPPCGRCRWITPVQQCLFCQDDRRTATDCT